MKTNDKILYQYKDYKPEILINYYESATAKYKREVVIEYAYLIQFQKTETPYSEQEVRDFIIKKASPECSKLRFYMPSIVDDVVKLLKEKNYQFKN